MAPMQDCHCPETTDEVQRIVRESQRLVVVGARTKPPLSACDEAVPTVSTRKLTGILEYAPTEFVVTVLAGTPAQQLDRALQHHFQYLPFDPWLSERGATIGGIVAAGVSGPCRLRYGGVRDFVIGARFIDGTGKLVCGGGKVVKNAAGFDFPKLMVGSRGRLGILTELTLKVLPRPACYETLQLTCQDLSQALALQTRLFSSPLELEAIDLEPPSKLLVRIAGLPAATGTLSKRIAEFAQAAGCDVFRCSDEKTETQAWRPLQDGSFADANECIVRATLTPPQIPSTTAALQSLRVRHRFSVAGNVVWIAWPETRDLDELDEMLRRRQLSASVLTGPSMRSDLGMPRANAFQWRIQDALDPQAKFSRHANTMAQR